MMPRPGTSRRGCQAPPPASNTSGRPSTKARASDVGGGRGSRHRGKGTVAGEVEEDGAANQLINAMFDRAVDIVQTLPRSGPIQTSYDDKLLLYSLYKQGTEGNVATSQPGILDMLGRAKWNAWSKRKDLSEADAKRLYVDSLVKILRSYRDSPQAVALIRELENFTDPRALVQSGHSIPSQPAAGAHSSSSHESDSASETSESEGESEASMPPASLGPYISKSQLPAPVESQIPPSDRRSIPDSAHANISRRKRRPKAGREQDLVSEEPESGTELERPTRRMPARSQTGYSVAQSLPPPPLLPPQGFYPSASAVGGRGWGPATPVHTLSNISASAPATRYFPPPPQTLGLPPPTSEFSVVRALGAGARVAAATAPEMVPVTTTSGGVEVERALDSIQTSLVALSERLRSLESRRHDAGGVPASDVGRLLRRILFFLGLVSSPHPPQLSDRLSTEGLATAIFLGLWNWARRLALDLALLTVAVGAILRWRRGDRVWIGWTGLGRWVFGEPRPDGRTAQGSR